VVELCLQSPTRLHDMVSGLFLESTAYRPALGPTHPPIQWVLGALSLVVKRPGRDADHSPPSSAEVKSGGAMPPLPHASSWHGLRISSRVHGVQTGSGAHHASYHVGTGGYFPGGKVAGAWG
jgi:hypothetical protein